MTRAEGVEGAEGAEGAEVQGALYDCNRLVFYHVGLQGVCASWRLLGTRASLCWRCAGKLKELNAI